MKTFRALGLMSGTSLDGLDLAYCQFRKAAGSWEYEIGATKSIPYDQEMRTRLQNAISLPAHTHLEFHNTYGTWLGQQARNFIHEHSITVDFIASHGHTSHHQPKKGITFQLGSGQHLANESGYKTICDFRTNDVALGGQGAPLVPIGDRLLFKDYDYCLNLGGISNMSLEHKGQRIAYDIGLANMILNHITQREGLLFDAGGGIARSGHLNKDMLRRLNQLEYYRQPIPKSTGYEWFLEEVVPIIDQTEADISSLLYTAVQHICEQVATQAGKFAANGNRTMLVTGGGAFNTYLVEQLQLRLEPTIRVVLPPRLLIEFKEALVFALMGTLRSEGEINVYCSVTGASRDSCSGVVYLPS